MQIILLIKIVLGKTASAARNWINPSPQTEATTFAFSSVFVLLLCCWDWVAIHTQKWLALRLHQRIYILWERIAPSPPGVLNWDAFLCSVCCILYYLSVCVTPDRAGWERLGEATQLKTPGGGGLKPVLRGYTVQFYLCLFVLLTLNTCYVSV